MLAGLFILHSQPKTLQLTGKQHSVASLKKKLPQICRRERTWTKYAFSRVNKRCVLIFSAQVTFAVCWRYFVPCKTRDDCLCTLSVSYPTLTLWRTLVLYRGLDTHLYAPSLQKVDQTLEYNRKQGYFFFSFSFLFSETYVVAISSMPPTIVINGQECGRHHLWRNSIENPLANREDWIKFLKIYVSYATPASFSVRWAVRRAKEGCWSETNFRSSSGFGTSCSTSYF